MGFEGDRFENLWVMHSFKAGPVLSLSKGLGVGLPGAIASAS